MSQESVTEHVPVCDLPGCRKRGSYGQMMPWPHSGWVTVAWSHKEAVSTTRLDFCCVDHAIAYLNAPGIVRPTPTPIIA